MTARAGLANFGAYIGTWESVHARDPRSASDYRLGQAAGTVAVRCTADDYVIVEDIRPTNQAPAGQALRIALTELPEDARKIYDHTHPGCRGLQYESAELARQLGMDDVDGHVGITFESDSRAYNAASVTVIRIDVEDVLGADSRLC